MEADGILSPVLDIQASYKKPLRYGEKAIIRTGLKNMTASGDIWI